MKIEWFYDLLTVSRAEINGFWAKGGGVYASLPMLAIHHGPIVSQGKDEGFEDQQEGYAAYFHSFEPQSSEVPSTSEQYQAADKNVYAEFSYKHLRVQLSRPSSILPRSVQFCISSYVWQIPHTARILVGLGHSVTCRNFPSNTLTGFLQ